MGRPKDPNKLVQLPCRVPAAIEEHIGALALTNNLTVSETIRVLLEERLKEHPVNDIQRAAYKRRRLEEMGIEPSRRRGLRSVRALAPGREDRSEPRRRAA